MKVFAALLVLASCAAVQSPASPAQERRAAYIHDVAALLGDSDAQQRVARLVDSRVLTELVPYGMGKLLGDADHREQLARWIADMHRRGARVIAPIAGADRIAAVRDLPVDGMVSEVEYWNAPDRAAAFDQLLALLASARAGGMTHVGAYLGYPTAEEAARLAKAVDFVFLNYSVREPERAWQHVHAGQPLADRFAWFARAGVAVWPIFYAEGEVDMRAYLAAHGLAAAEAAFRGAAPADQRVAGFVYFTVEHLPQ